MIPFRNHVDTNVIAYLWLPGKRTAAAERLLKDWNAPLLWRSEFRNCAVEKPIGSVVAYGIISDSNPLPCDIPRPTRRHGRDLQSAGG